MPTAATDTFTYDALMPFMNPEKAALMHVPLAEDDYAKGTILGEITATGLYAAYATAAVDGTGVAKVILQYACTVDSSNNITIADGSGLTSKTAPVYLAGQGCIWESADLTGLDADGLVDMHGSIMQGDLTTGLVVI